MDRSPNLDMPYLLPAQAQKHVTHNEALQTLDALVQLSVKDRDLAAPPASPAEGDRYVVAAGASGDWAGQEASVAAWIDGAWRFLAPMAGWFAWVVDEAVIAVFDASTWTDLGTVVGSFQNLPLLGIGTTADAANPFSAKLNNALLTAKTAAEGGDGDLKIKANKEAAGDTVSYLFQTGYSGRAEFGLIGDDNFTLKVSADGSAWNDAIVIDKATGTVSFPNSTLAGGREVLAANRTYYVRIDGSNSNDGLTNTAGGAFLTLQKAMDVIAGSIDTAGYKVTVQVGDGTYTAGISLKPWVGGGTLTFQGNNATPANVFVSVTGSHCFQNVLGALPGAVTIKDMKLGTTTSGYCINATAPCVLTIDAVNFAAAAQIHILARAGVTIDVSKNYTISGSAGWHWYSSGGSFTNSGAGPTLTISGTPAFTQFARAEGNGYIYCGGHLFSGSATGSRYSCTLNGLINTAGGGANFLPGNAAGSTATGGQYV